MPCRRVPHAMWKKRPRGGVSSGILGCQISLGDGADGSPLTCLRATQTTAFMLDSIYMPELEPVAPGTARTEVAGPISSYLATVAAHCRKDKGVGNVRTGYGI